MFAICLTAVIAKIDENISNEILKTSSHDTIVKLYFDYNDDSRVQQQILWMLESYVYWPSSRRKIQRSDTCLKLIKLLMDMRADLVKKSAVSTEVSRSLR